MIVNDEVKKKIVEMYKKGEEVRVIANICEVGKGTLYEVLDAEGIERRQHKQSFTRLRVCENCGGKLPTGAKYCPECGKFVLDKKQIALNNVGCLREVVQYLPRDRRDGYQEKINAVENYIKINGLR